MPQAPEWHERRVPQRSLDGDYEAAEGAAQEVEAAGEDAHEHVGDLPLGLAGHGDDGLGGHGGCECDGWDGMGCAQGRGKGRGLEGRAKPGAAVQGRGSGVARRRRAGGGRAAPGLPPSSKHVGLTVGACQGNAN